MPHETHVRTHFVTLLAATALQAESPFTGRWALTIPGGGAGWLGVEEKDRAVQQQRALGRRQRGAHHRYQDRRRQTRRDPSDQAQEKGRQRSRARHRNADLHRQRR